MRRKIHIGVLLCLVLARGNSFACIWDAETMLQERLRSPDLADVILKGPPKPPDPAPLRDRIRSLIANPQTNDPAWWDNLAGAHLRLGQAAEAAALLETVTNKFPKEYGIHANLGTAYHLLGRYADAEREIARDLEINPDAHFGVERYHLALLQYLVRDAAYQKEHVYVDEWSDAFFMPNGGLRFLKPAGRLNPAATNDLGERLTELEKYADKDGNPDTNGWPGNEITALKASAFAAEPPPPYRYKWDLAADQKFKDGVIYMATMNPKEPACFVMLGIACVKNRDYNLAVAAFKRAIQLGSLQSLMLQIQVDDLNHYISESLKFELEMLGFLSLIPIVIAIYIISKIRERRRKKKAAAFT